MKPPSLATVRSAQKPDAIPAGWFSRAQLEEEWRLSSSTTRHVIQKSIREGRAEKREFRSMTSRGILPVPHYKFLKQK
jgi:hypothetical protein